MTGTVGKKIALAAVVLDRGERGEAGVPGRTRLIKVKNEQGMVKGYSRINGRFGGHYRE